MFKIRFIITVSGVEGEELVKEGQFQLTAPPKIVDRGRTEAGEETWTWRRIGERSNEHVDNM